MQGADRVNDELEVGFDERFELRWLWAQRIGRVVMIAFVAAALAGLLGRGPYSHRTLACSEAGMTVDFEPVARSGAPTQVTLHLYDGPPPLTARIFVSTQMVEPMGLERILPQPVTSAAVGDGLELTLATEPGATDAHVRFVLRPTAVGPIEITARREGFAPLRWTQMVMP